MKFDLSKIELSNKDLKNNIKLPDKLTDSLSYLLGVHIGDGSMNYYKNDGNYHIQYDGHLIDEWEFYSQKVAFIIEKLFNKKPHIIKCIKDTTVRVCFKSKGILNFLNKIADIPMGPKINVSIPKIILMSKKEKIFLKGLADTDFSLVFKKKHKTKHYYPVISYETPDKLLIKQIYKILLNMGFKLYLGLDYKRERNGTNLVTNHLNINGTKNLEKWMKLIGFSSPKHITKYKIWKKYGFCPSNTNIIDRYKILNGEININKFYQT